MKYRTIALATLYLLPAAVVFAQSPGMESVYFGGGSPWHMFADRLLYVLFALAVAIGIMAAIIKWAAPYIAPNLDEAEAIIKRAAMDNNTDGGVVTTGDGITAAGIILSTTLRIAIIFWAIQTFATRL